MLTDLMNEALAKHGLSRSQAQVIHLLDRYGALVQRELAEELGCTARNVTILIDQLEEAGLVERSAHPKDRRATCVSLTGKGTDLAHWFSQEKERTAQNLLESAPSRDIAGFMRITALFLNDHAANSSPLGQERA